MRAEDAARDRRAVRILRDRHLQPVIGAGGHVRAHASCRAPRSMPALSPCHALARPDVAERALGRVEQHRPAAIRHVVPQEAARLRHVDRLGDDERRDVADLAVRVLAELDVLDDLVARIVGIELAEGAAGDLLVLAGVAVSGARRAFAERGRDRLVDDDFGDAGVSGAEQTRIPAATANAVVNDLRKRSNNLSDITASPGSGAQKDRCHKKSGADNYFTPFRSPPR